MNLIFQINGGAYRDDSQRISLAFEKLKILDGRVERRKSGFDRVSRTKLMRNSLTESL